MATRTSPADVRRSLMHVAGRRRLAQQNDAALAEKTKELVKSAQDVGISMAEVARLLGIDRSTLYRVYVDAARS